MNTQKEGLNISFSLPDINQRSFVSAASGFHGSEMMLGNDRAGRKVALTAEQRKNHTHILGSTGTGKSKFLEYMIRQDVFNKKAGLCLLDPHGSLYDEILRYLSPGLFNADK